MRSRPVLHKHLAALFLIFAALPALAEEPIILISRLVAAQGHEEEVAARQSKVEKFMKESEPGNTYKVYRDKKDPAVFVIYEVIPTKAALDLHMKETLPAAKKAFPLDKSFVAKPLETQVLKALSP